MHATGIGQISLDQLCAHQRASDRCTAGLAAQARVSLRLRCSPSFGHPPRGGIVAEKPISLIFTDDKYLRNMEDDTTDDIGPQTGSDMRLDAQRDIIRQSLDAIVNDIGMAMRDVGLTFPLYITVRNSGDALVTIATSLDPLDKSGSRHRHSSAAHSKRGLAAVGWEGENSPVLSRTPGR